MMLLSTDIESKLDMLFKKNEYTLAINPGQNLQADVVATSEVIKKIWGSST